MYFWDRGAKIQKNTFRYVVSKRIFSDPGAKIEQDTFRDVVSKCICLYLSTPFGKTQKRYIQIHVDTLWYIQMHRPQKIVRTETNNWPNFSSEFQFSNSRSTGDSDSLYVNQQSDQRSAKENACRRRMLLQNHVQIRPYIYP